MRFTVKIEGLIWLIMDGQLVVESIILVGKVPDECSIKCRFLAKLLTLIPLVVCLAHRMGDSTSTVQLAVCKRPLVYCFPMEDLASPVGLPTEVSLPKVLALNTHHLICCFFICYRWFD